MTLALHILKVLRAAGDCLTPETQLRDDLRILVSPVPTGTNISEQLDRIETNKWAVSFRDAETGTIRWQITDSGRAQLATRNL